MLGRVCLLRIVLEVGVHADCTTLRDLPENGDDCTEGEAQDRSEGLAAPFLAGHLVVNVD